MKKLLCCVPRKNTRQSHAMCQRKAHDKECLCRVPKKDTRQSINLSCPFFYCVLSLRHKAKHLFAVCPIKCTRWTIGHTANYGFPVKEAETFLYKELRQLATPSVPKVIAEIPEQINKKVK